MICLLSKHWNRSHECAAEYRHVESLHKTILCARLEPVPDTNKVKGYQTLVDPDTKVDASTAMISAGRLQSLLDARSGQPDIVDLMVATAALTGGDDLAKIVD